MNEFGRGILGGTGGVVGSEIGTRTILFGFLTDITLFCVDIISVPKKLRVEHKYVNYSNRFTTHFQSLSGVKTTLHFEFIHHLPNAKSLLKIRLTGSQNLTKTNQE